MKIPRALHSWSVSPKRAVVIQRSLASRIIRTGRVPRWRLVAGTDVAFARGGEECIAGVVVWDVQTGTVQEQHIVRHPTRFPYVPGLLSFREAPAIIKALRLVRAEPDVLMFDGQGLAHPRRFGLACHVGLLVGCPSLGCAKSLLVGTCAEPGRGKASTSPLHDHGECIGMALRTRDNVKPVYVSVGHRLCLEAAVEITLACCTGFRLPEPTRLADRLVSSKRAG